MRDSTYRRSSEGFRGAALRPKTGFKENDPEEAEEVGAPLMDRKKPAGGEPTGDSFNFNRNLYYFFVVVVLGPLVPPVLEPLV
jgi:hypothetical protein